MVEKEASFNVAEERKPERGWQEEASDKFPSLSLRILPLPVPSLKKQQPARRPPPPPQHYVKTVCVRVCVCEFVSVYIAFLEDSCCDP